MKHFIVKNFFILGDIRKSFSMLRPYIIKYRKAYLGLFFFLSLDIFLTLAFAWFLGQITDAAIQTDFQSLNWLVPLGIVLLLLSLTSSYAGIYLRAITENAVKKDLRVDLFNHILRLPTKQQTPFAPVNWSLILPMTSIVYWD
ncbi:ABC transporter transmembrane domain-containing protein [Caldalkalibacillus mannanilyticus]|uniref:ABC transporter transmembrane domain-containing protein n=1 Tax=Caldalkalibacillus mannanilyticus TaxID=1418 RepID=UPI00227738E1|nr:ABC transporter transmembrane domain-containing protein [Caldalkalibacillus mannanilyticus]